MKTLLFVVFAFLLLLALGFILIPSTDTTSSDSHKNNDVSVRYFYGQGIYTFEDRGHLFMMAGSHGIIHHPACKCQNK